MTKKKPLPPRTKDGLEFTIGMPLFYLTWATLPAIKRVDTSNFRLRRHKYHTLEGKVKREWRVTYDKHSGTNVALYYGNVENVFN